MREIKFRVWNVNNLEPRYWDLSFLYYEEFDGKEPIFEQFTGLKDVNGKDIYEGDIVVKKLIKNNRPYTVGSFNPFIVEWGVCGFNLSFMKTHTCEVIGNIHENPELVK